MALAIIYRYSRHRKCQPYQILNDLLDSSHHQDEEQRHQRRPTSSGRYIWNLLSQTQEEIHSARFFIKSQNTTLEKKKSASVKELHVTRSVTITTLLTYCITYQRDHFSELLPVFIYIYLTNVTPSAPRLLKQVRKKFKKLTQRKLRNQGKIR